MMSRNDGQNSEYRDSSNRFCFPTTSIHYINDSDEPKRGGSKDMSEISFAFCACSFPNLEAELLDLGEVSET